VLVASVVTVGLGLAACSSGRPLQPTNAAERDAAAAESGCRLVDAEAVSRVMAQQFTVEPQTDGSQRCTFVRTDGAASVTIDVAEASTGDALAALVSANGLTELDAEVNDQVFVAEQPEASTGTTPTWPLLVRFGGSTALVRLTSPDPAEVVQAQLLELARAIGPALPAVPFDGQVTVEPAACDQVDVGSLGAALSVDPSAISVAALPGTTGCAVGVAGSPITATITAEGEGSVESLQGRGGSITTDGETFTIEPQPVDVAGGGVWLADPVTGTSGELFAVVFDRLVRVTATGAPADQLVGWAAAIAANAGPGVAR
jgi:hypothetical protein